MIRLITRFFWYDYNKMKLSNAALVVHPIGNDCSSEIGFLHGIGKYCASVLIEFPFVSIDKQIANLRFSWMVKGFLSEILFEEPRVLEILQEDTALKHKLCFLKESTLFTYR